MDVVFDKSGRLNASVEVGKFTVLIMDHTRYNDGVDVPSAANVGPVMGVAQESVVPNGFADYTGGTYPIVSGTAWPAGAIPASVLGRGISFRMLGISRAVAAAAITAGAHVNIADSAGRIKAVNETAGTVINEVGWALEAAGQANDVIRIMVFPVVRHS